MSSQHRAQKLPRLQVSPADPTLGSPSSHDPGSSTQIDGSLKGSESLSERNDARSWIWNQQTGQNQRRMTIDILPDDVLLEIFDFLDNRSKAENWWHTLVHVCRKWRNVIFGSPHRLNLRLVCSDRTLVRKMLDVWPPLPIVILNFTRRKSGGDNIIAALERNDRVCQITLKVNPQWEKVLDAMQKPFPALTRLVFSLNIEIPLVVPDSFIGGSAPRLQVLHLERCPIPGLPKLLLSATDLVHLNLWRIPHSGYISPEAMITCLSTLPRLEELCLKFQSPQSRPNRESRLGRLLPPTRSVLPALIKLQFAGVSEYLEDFVARIDSPILDSLDIKLFHQLIFDTPQLIQFISRTPTLEMHDEAQVYFSELNVGVGYNKASSSSCHLSLQILCRQPEWQLSSIAQICTSLFSLSSIHMVERLYIRERSSSMLEWQDDIEGSQWVELLRPFTAVTNLWLSKKFAPRIAPSLQELVGGMTTEVLPALQTLVLEELHPSTPFEDAIKKFVAARQLSNHPVAISEGEIVIL